MLPHMKEPYTRACKYCEASFHIDDPDNVVPEAGFYGGQPMYPLDVCADCEHLVPNPEDYGLESY